ncbi:3'-5' exonuclease [Candidatus Lokiarchaeum ossiferum]|uniref:3'-5' exonuclease n=1 Tax=Candidatus Lokiarchaeum ossiferum TaxID=2951803 RepID=UPI00352CA081
MKKFSKSYRNPIEIGQIAQCALPTAISYLINRFEEFIATDEFSGKHGNVEFVIAKSRTLEYHELATKIQHICQETKTNILVLFRRNVAKQRNQHPFLQELLQLHITWENLKYFHHQGYGIHIGTVHGTKGLEAEIVIIPELDTYTSDENRQLLYVGMTRARSRLILSACRSTPLIRSLQEKSQQ